MTKSWIENHELIAFFVLAYAFSWLIEIPLILSRLGLIGAIPLWMHYLTAYGPVLAAIVVQVFPRAREEKFNCYQVL